MSLRICLAVSALCALLAIPSWSKPDEGHTIFQSLARQVSAIREYAVEYRFTDHLEGKAWKFDYRCSRAGTGRILTHIIEGPNRGTSLFYSSAASVDKIRVKFGILRMWKSVQDLKLGKTPLVRSLLDMLVAELGAYPKCSVLKSPQPDVVVLQFEDGAVKDQLALDKASLTPLWRRKFDGDKPVISCEIDSLKINTGEDVQLR